MFISSRSSRLAALATAVIALVPASAHAAKTTSSTTSTSTTTTATSTEALQSSCTNNTAKQVFLPWSDAAWYSLTPEGDLEATTLTGWTFADGAKRVAGSETFNVTGTAGKYSVGFGPSGAAVSAPVCVNAKRPTFRFFVRNAGANPRARLKVEILYTNSTTGAPESLAVGEVKGTGTWAPSPVLQNPMDLVLSETGDVRVRYRFKSIDSDSSFQIDDLYIDPAMRG